MAKLDDRPTTFAELAEVIDQLHIIVVNTRRAHRLSQRELARRVGVSFSTISRVEAGEELSSVTLAAILRWLDQGSKP